MSLSHKTHFYASTFRPESGGAYPFASCPDSMLKYKLFAATLSDVHGLRLAHIDRKGWIAFGVGAAGPRRGPILYLALIMSQGQISRQTFFAQHVPGMFLPRQEHVPPLGSINSAI